MQMSDVYLQINATACLYFDRIEFNAITYSCSGRMTTNGGEYIYAVPDCLDAMPDADYFARNRHSLMPTEGGYNLNSKA